MWKNFDAWMFPNVGKKDGSTLCEFEVSHVRYAHEAIGVRPNKLTPVVIKPHNASFECCCCLKCPFVSVPSGFHAIVTKFGAEVPGDAEDGTWSPGCHFFSPLNTVDKLVSTQMIVFDTPVKDCKTKDNINVSIDVLITFEVTNGKAFVYNVGPEKFDDMLRASEAEVMRTLANDILVENIHDLYSADATQIVEDLNKKFSKYGVNILQFVVKSVKIPRQMADDFEEKTLFDSKTKEKHVVQSSDRLKLNNQENHQKLREECDNARMAAEEQAEVSKARIVKEIAEFQAESEKEIMQLQTEKAEEARAVVTNGELEVSKLQSQILALDREVRSKTTAEVGKLDAESKAYMKTQEAEGKVEEAKRHAEGKKALAEAEGEAAAAFQARRQQEADMGKLNILEKLATNQNIQIATSQENTSVLNPDNKMVTQVAQQGLEAIRAKLAEVTAASVKQLKAPQVQSMR